MSPEVKKLIKHDTKEDRVWIVWDPGPIYEEFKPRFVTAANASENNVP